PLAGPALPRCPCAPGGRWTAGPPPLPAAPANPAPPRREPPAAPPARRSAAGWAVAALLAAVALLTGLNLWQTVALQRQVAKSAATAPAETRPEAKATVRETSPSPDVGDRERFAGALYELLLDHGGKREGGQGGPGFQA